MKKISLSTYILPAALLNKVYKIDKPINLLYNQSAKLFFPYQYFIYIAECEYNQDERKQGTEMPAYAQFSRILNIETHPKRISIRLPQVRIS